MGVRAFASNERGAVAIMAAVGGALVCLVAGIAVDGASMAFEARRYQSAADLAALAAASRLDRPQSAAESTVLANLATAETIVLETGVYDPDPSRDPADRFRTHAAGETPNAARVTVSGHARLYFGKLVLGRETAAIRRTGLAALPHREPAAAFSIGSRLARLEDGLANEVLGALTGSKVSLSVMDYRALAAADVNLLSFVDALAIRSGVTAGDYDRLLDTRISAGKAIRAIEGLTEGVNPALDKLARSADGLQLKVGDLIGTDVEATDGLRAGLDARVSALDLASAVVEVAAGDRQAKLDTGLRTGLADLDVWLAIGERPNHSPWLSVSRNGQPTVRTAQARLYIEAKTSAALSGITQLRLPVIVELASAEATLSRLHCGAEPEVALAVRPGVARARIGAVDVGRLNDFKRPLAVQPASLASIPGILTVSGSADVEAAPAQATPVVFDARAIAGRTPKTVSSTGFTSGAVSSALGRLDLQVNVLGLGLGLGDLAAKAGQLLRPVGPVLDTLVDGVLATLGLSVGQADVTVQGLSCQTAAGTPRLVG